MPLDFVRKLNTERILEGMKTRIIINYKVQNKIIISYEQHLLLSGECPFFALSL